MIKLGLNLLYYCALGVIGSWLIALVLQAVWIIPAWMFAWGSIFWIHKFAWFTLTWTWWIGKWACFWWTPLFFWGISGLGKTFWFFVWVVLEYWYMFLYVLHCFFAGGFTTIYMGPRYRRGFGIYDWNEANNIAEYMVLYLSDQKITKLPEEVLTVEQRKIQIARFYNSIAQGAMLYSACIGIPLMIQLLDWKILPAFPYRVAGTFISVLITTETIKCIFSAQDKFKRREHPQVNFPTMDWRADQAIYLLLMSGLVLLEWVVIPPVGVMSFKALKVLCF